MIWVGGAIVPDDSLKISVLDRTFEHGLGLFETFRTWNGHATLLDRHLARMRRSAEALRLPLDPDALPDANAVAALREADGHAGDAMFRMTMSGGLSETTGSVVWMRSAPIPPPMGDHRGAVVLTGSALLDPSDPLARFKSLNYWKRKLAHEDARSRGGDEALMLGPPGDFEGMFEGSRSNVFAVVGDALLSPRETAPILPGIMRSVVAGLAPRVGLQVIDSDGIALEAADEVFLTNSVRGIVPVRRVDLREIPSPGPRTSRLQALLESELAMGRMGP